MAMNSAEWITFTIAAFASVNSHDHNRLHNRTLRDHTLHLAAERSAKRLLLQEHTRNYRF